MLKTNFKDANFIIEGDIRDCFGSIDHKILLTILNRKIKCEKTLKLIKILLEAGFFLKGVYNKTDIGVPQGTIVGPVLCNIYMSEFDSFIEGLIKIGGKPLLKENPLY